MFIQQFYGDFVEIHGIILWGVMGLKLMWLVKPASLLSLLNFWFSKSMTMISQLSPRKWPGKAMELEAIPCNSEPSVYSEKEQRSLSSGDFT